MLISAGFHSLARCIQRENPDCLLPQSIWKGYRYDSALPVNR